MYRTNYIPLAASNQSQNLIAYIILRVVAKCRHVIVYAASAIIHELIHLKVIRLTVVMNDGRA